MNGGAKKSSALKRGIQAFFQRKVVHATQASSQKKYETIERTG